MGEEASKMGDYSLIPSGVFKKIITINILIIIIILL